MIVGGVRDEGKNPSFPGSVLVALPVIQAEVEEESDEYQSNGEHCRQTSRQAERAQQLGSPSIPHDCDRQHDDDAHDTSDRADCPDLQRRPLLGDEARDQRYQEEARSQGQERDGGPDQPPVSICLSVAHVTKTLQPEEYALAALWASAGQSISVL